MLKAPSLLITLIILIFLTFSISLLLDVPLVWPDEAIYGDIAHNLMSGNRGTNLWKGFISGIENHAYSLPPFFLYSSSIWYKLFGFTITSQRLFSVFLGTSFLICFYTISKKIIHSKNKSLNKIVPLAATFLLSIDFIFLSASRIGRPEILVLVLVAVATIFYFKSFKEKNLLRENLMLFLAGLFLGLSVITHLIATGFALAITIALIYSKGKKLFHNKRYLFFLSGLLAPVLIWQAWLFPYHKYFFDQLHLVQLSRQHTIVWYKNVLNSDFLIQVNFLIYFLSSISFTLLTLKNKEKHTYILLSLMILAAWFFTTLGTLFWYTVYGVTFAYFALAILIQTAFSSKSDNLLPRLFKFSLIIICLTLICANIATYTSQYFTLQGKQNYEIFSSQIIEAIPPGKTVYLSSLPDAYYAFPPGRNTLLEFPALFSGKDNFLRTLLQADYLILNGAYIPDPNAFGFLDRYVYKNLDSAKELTSPYSVMILKMKEKSLRSID